MSDGLSPTPKNIYNELTTFIYERDQAFRTLKKDTARVLREEKEKVIIISPLDDDYDDLSTSYNSTKLDLAAAYHLPGSMHASKQSRIIFKIALTSITQLSELPATLATRLDDEQRERFSQIEIGNLNEKRRAKYIVKHGVGDEINVVRNTSYELRENKLPLYIAQYPVSKNDFERVAVASEQRTIVVPPRIEQEQSRSVSDQVEYDAALSAMCNTTERPNFTQEEYEQDAVLSIRALLKILRSSAPLPAPTDELYSSDIQTPPKK